MGFFEELFDRVKKQAGCDSETVARMSEKSDRELIRLVQDRSRDQVGAFAELKRRYGTDEANAKVRRGF